MSAQTARAPQSFLTVRRRAACLSDGVAKTPFTWDWPLVKARAQLDEGADLGRQHGEEKGQGLGLGFEAVDDAHDAVGLAETHAFKERVEVKARIARDGLAELFGRDFALGIEERELFDFLCGGKEVAFHHVGEVVERFVRHDEAVTGEPAP